MASHQCKLHIAVVGGGVNGLCTAWQLLERGHRVTLIEQFPMPHSRGSSHGHSRVTRSAYKISGYSGLMRHAFPLWSKLESLSGQRLFINCGMACLGSQQYMETISQTLDSNSLQYERLTGESLGERFPGLGHFAECIFDPSAGILLADKCLQALRSRVSHLGGTVRDGVRVTSVNPLSDGSVRLKLDCAGGGDIDGSASETSLLADAVILATGAWAGRLLGSLGLNLPLQPIGVSALYWRRRTEDEVESSSLYGPEKFPAFVYEDEQHSVFFGLPEFEYPGMIKICYDGGPKLDPDVRETAEQRALAFLPALTEFVRQRFPDLVPEPAVIENCIYTMTPDHGLIVDRHPKHPNILFVCGCSGHGFKLAPIIGQLLAQMATGEQPSADVGFMSASRFPVDDSSSA